jgi:DNA-directed RNA polymerase specialized sigma subunit
MLNKMDGQSAVIAYVNIREIDHTNDLELQKQKLQLKETIFYSFHKLAYAVAKKFNSFFPDRGDWQGVANLAIYEALERYTPTLADGSPIMFSTYLQYFVQGRVKNYIRDTNAIGVPNHIYEKTTKYNKTTQALRNALDREPTAQEVAELMGTSEDMVEDIQNALICTQKFSSIHSSADNEDGEDWIANVSEDAQATVLGSKPSLEVVDPDTLIIFLDKIKGCKSVRSIAAKFNCSFETARQLNILKNAAGV